MSTMSTISMKIAKKAMNFGLLLLMLLSTGFGAVAPAKASANEQSLSYAIVFVSRKIPTNGSVYYPARRVDAGRDAIQPLPGCRPGQVDRP
jgi:hypothetical protein